MSWSGLVVKIMVRVHDVLGSNLDEHINVFLMDSLVPNGL
jgi:hypothetical protein